MIIDGIALKGKIIIIIPALLQEKALKQLHIKHIVIAKTRLLAHKSIYWINMNADTEDTVKMSYKS